MRKIIGLAFLFVAIGMLLSYMLASRLTGFIIMAVFALLGYYALFGNN